MKLRSALLAATVLVAPVAAKAQVVNGLYIGAGAGANIMMNSTINKVFFPQLGVSGGRLSGGSVSYDVGAAGVASVGYGLGNGFRVEAEGGVLSNQFHHVSNGLIRTSAGGNEYKYTAFLNGFYDFNLASFGLPLPITPYVGLGIGYAYVQDQNARFFGYGGQTASTTTLFRTNQGDSSLAYQAMLGAAYPIPGIPGLSLTAEYRFLGLGTDPVIRDQYRSSAPAPVGLSTRANVHFTDDYNHSILVGVRYAFNAAPPPVVAVPPPVATRQDARTYLVFFDWDKADLTARARQIIAEAAQATTRVQTTRIEVSGNTDTTGTAKYNLALSLRRANNVAAELVRLGVPRAAITTAGYGFSRPLVATGPGVREPQNRRVEIVLK